MKLSLRSSVVHGREVLLLCDETGHALPEQRDVKVHFTVDALAVITVEFVCDGKHIVSEMSQRVVDE